jgi:hypothetical protein
MDEVPLATYLAESLTEQGWSSRSGDVWYPNGNRRPDIVSEYPGKRLKITNEIKYMVCDWPGARRPRGAWKGLSGPSAQHLGIKPGKSINAVDDIDKLNQADGTHVSFLLVRFESRDRCGDEDVERFLNMTRLGQFPWKRYDAEWSWPHPKSQGHLVKCHLWCRPILTGIGISSRI